jgi:hypothetical protein
MRIRASIAASLVGAFAVVGVLAAPQVPAGAAPPAKMSATLQVTGCTFTLSVSWQHLPPTTRSGAYELDLTQHYDGAPYAPNKYGAPSNPFTGTYTLTVSATPHTFSWVAVLRHFSPPTAGPTTVHAKTMATATSNVVTAYCQETGPGAYG